MHLHCLDCEVSWGAVDARVPCWVTPMPDDTYLHLRSVS